MKKNPTCQKLSREIRYECPRIFMIDIHKLAKTHLSNSKHFASKYLKIKIKALDNNSVASDCNAGNEVETVLSFTQKSYYVQLVDSTASKLT